MQVTFTLDAASTNHAFRAGEAWGHAMFYVVAVILLVLLLRRLRRRRRDRDSA